VRSGIMVGHCGLEPQTPVLSGLYEGLLVEILRHLVAIGQLSQQVLASLDNDGHKAQYLEKLREFLQHQAR
jgi:hypothetical protein